MTLEIVTPDIEPEPIRAARHKQAISNALQIVVAACEDARKDGFHVEFNAGLNQFGQYSVNYVGLIKRF